KSVTCVEGGGLPISGPLGGGAHRCARRWGPRFAACTGFLGPATSAGGQGRARSHLPPTPPPPPRPLLRGARGVTPPPRRRDTDPATCRRQGGWTQLVVVAGALGFYEVVHLLTGTQRAAALQHARAVLGFERLFRIDWEQSVQSFSLHSDTLRSAANGVYTWM